MDFFFLIGGLKNSLGKREPNDISLYFEIFLGTT